jgi:integrase
MNYSAYGVSYRVSSKSRDRRVALKLLRQRLAEVRTGTHNPAADRVRLADLEQMLKDDYAANRRRSLNRALLSWRHLSGYFGEHTRAIDVTADRINAYLAARLGEDAAPATIQNELAALKRGFSLAVRAGRLHHKPAFPVIAVSNSRTGFFEEADFRALLAELPPELQAPLTFAFHTGWRLASEVLTLRWSQVDLAAGTVRLEPGTTKNNEGREWPLSALPELAALLQRQREHTSVVERELGAIVPWVFHRSGAPILSLRRAWKNACRRTGLSGRIPHDLRRGAVRGLERAGVSRSVAMKLVGHKTQSIYSRYAIVSSRDLAEGVAKLAAQRATQTIGERSVVPLRRATRVATS